MPVGIATNALPLAEGLAERLAERDAGVLDRVMHVDVEVAFGADLEVNAGMAGDLLQHVVEEADSRRNARRPGTVEADADRNCRLVGLARDRGAAHAISSAVERARLLSSPPAIGHPWAELW